MAPRLCSGKIAVAMISDGDVCGRTNTFQGAKGRYIKSDTHIKTSNWNY